MNIEIRHEIGDQVYLLCGGEIILKEVDKIKIYLSSETPEGFAHYHLKDFNGIYTNRQLFKAKEELVNSLIPRYQERLKLENQKQGK